MENQTQPAPEPRIDQEEAPRDEHRDRASGKPLRASPFSWETASRVRAPWRR